jgi:Flp pilus assembly protein TadG
MARNRLQKSFTKLIRRFAHNDDGNLMLMTSVLCIPLIAAAGIAIDYGRATRAHQALQIVADTATLAAASTHNLSGSSSSQATVRSKIATSYVTAEMKGIGDLWISTPPTVASTANSITVTIPAKVKGSLTNVLSLLSQSALLGSGGGGSSSGTGDYMDIDVTAKSKASWTTGPQYLCMLALNASKSQAMSIQGTADIKATNCAVYVDSSASDALYENGNATVTASNIYVVGNYSGAAYYPLPTIHAANFPDPLAASYATDYAATYASATARGDFNTAGSTLNPGLYTCSNKKTSVTNGQTITLNAGVYYIKDCTLQVKSGGTLNGLGGVSIILVGNGSNIDIQAGGNLNLQAPAAGRFAGIALAQDKNVTGVAASGGSRNSVIGGGTLSVTGVIYFPTHDFYVTGNGFSLTQLSVGNPQFAIVADTITIQGNGQVYVGGGSDYNSAGLPALPISGNSKSVISLN